MKKRRFLPLLAVAAFVAASASQAEAQEPTASPAMSEVVAADLEWNAIEVPGFRSGLEIATIHGDPSVEGEPYTLRLAFPDGYEFPPHWHPRAENVTVLEGTFLVAMGEEFDEDALQAYEPGDYLFVEAENAHFGAVEGRTVVQLHGPGPFEISVVEGQEMSGS